MQVWFLQSSRFGQAYVFAYCMLFSLGHARPFGMLHAHLLVHAYTTALRGCASACTKHHPFLQACALVQACFCCCKIERIACCRNACPLLPVLQAVRWCHRLDPMLSCQMMAPLPKLKSYVCPGEGHG